MDPSLAEAIDWCERCGLEVVGHREPAPQLCAHPRRLGAALRPQLGVGSEADVNDAVVIRLQ